GVDALMHLGHEFVEMRAALVRDLRLLEEQVHQHGLAAPDLAMDVEPARRRLVLVGEQPAEQALLLDRLVAGKPLLQFRKGFRRAALRRIGLDRARRDEGFVMGVEGGGRGREHGPLSASAREKLQAGNWAGGYAPRHHSLACPALAGHPVRRGLSAQALTFLEYWIARTSRAMTALLWRERAYALSV